LKDLEPIDVNLDSDSVLRGPVDNLKERIVSSLATFEGVESKMFIKEASEFGAQILRAIQEPAQDEQIANDPPAVEAQAISLPTLEE